MKEAWDAVLDQYVHHLISPDGRDTFESTSLLVEKMRSLCDVRDTDTLVDIGCGWGNFALAAAKYARNVVGIEPDPANIRAAKRRSAESAIQYIQGSFEEPNYAGKADWVISSLVFHQVSYDRKITALQNIANMLNPNGRFVLCDPIILFDAEKEIERFNEVYRYLLRRTTPRDVYQKYIEPTLEEGIIYTWQDMKAYTPKDNWFYSIAELETWLFECGLKIIRTEELAPFFGIVVIALEAGN